MTRLQYWKANKINKIKDVIFNCLIAYLIYNLFIILVGEGVMLQHAPVISQK